MGETVDVLVIGMYIDCLQFLMKLLLICKLLAGNYGTGKRSGGVSTLICAVLDDRRMGNDDDELKCVSLRISHQFSLTFSDRYSAFVRIGTGLTYGDYVWIRQKNWKPLDKSNLPPWYQSAKRISSEDKGDVYLEPEEFVMS